MTAEELQKQVDDLITQNNQLKAERDDLQAKYDKSCLDLAEQKLATEKAKNDVFRQTSKVESKDLTLSKILEGIR